ncbi:MAG TPA: D-aminoacyl-tRNA deacylase [Terriglobales bacterium]|jgi:D-aminoacyl-tRNA deacylase|nr:D-aminoacyl-tRNA deacylase [Terriglobales bacterium]
MRAVVQRVKRAQVTVNGEITGNIDRGFLVFVGVAHNDAEADANYLADKVTGLRVFEDENGKMSLAVGDIGGAILVVSQFTLLGDVRRGKRPAFDAAAPPQRARELYEHFVQRIRAVGLHCETGRFQEMMQVDLVNDGPVTILIDSAKTF